MYKINPTTNKTINTELALIRSVNPEQALKLRQLYNNLECKTFTTIPETGVELVKHYNGEIASFLLTSLGNTLIEHIEFEEVEELDIPEIETTDVVDRFAFIETTEIKDMTAAELNLVLVQRIGSDLEAQTNSMQAGSKIRLDELDILKDRLISNIESKGLNREKVELKLANALALTKIHSGSSLATGPDGNLAVYDYINSSLKTECANFVFMAKLDGNKTKPLEILILKATLKTYKEEVARGKLPVTSSELNLAITRMISGLKPTSEEALSKLDNLTF
ncbi:MAG: hypothetical protein DRP85_08625 [Candidatus Makaraimicrobium thalassicum]|nr:MAG: hypothetical protein DRP85_08625 [Candidatus Omnitrophota bacterium]